MAIMSVREGLAFETELGSDTCNIFPAVNLLLEAFGKDIYFLRDPTRSGVATVQNNIRLSEQVEGACEMLGLDPLYVAIEGIFIAVVQAEAAGQVQALLRTLPTGRNAATIESVTTTYPRQVILTSSIGDRRTPNMLAGEQLPRIC